MLTLEIYARKLMTAVGLVCSLLMLTNCATTKPQTPVFSPYTQPPMRMYQPTFPTQNNPTSPSGMQRNQGGYVGDDYYYDSDSGCSVGGGSVSC